MDPHETSHEKAPGIILQDVAGDEARAAHVSHDHDAEVAHAWDHFRENLYFFAGVFLPVILLTLITFMVDFGPYNKPVMYLMAALRCGLIAYFLSTLFKNFSFVFRTLFFTIIFLAGMIFLSLWDSEVRGIGNPIRDLAHPETMKE